MVGTAKRVEVKAAMAGVFYRKPSPSEPPYVEVGDAVKKGQVLALLETMKVFQKVKSPAAGKVVEILVENETPVMDETVLMMLEAS
jgi:acetyl-CoA carboxylase biotin carboxyl carrier protein